MEALVFDSSKLTACKAIIVRVDLTHLCISIAYIHKMHAIFIPACMCQNKSSNNCDHWKKKIVLQETEKNVWLRVGLNPQLRWLTTVCLSGFGRNVQQLFTVFSLHQCLQRAVMNERTNKRKYNHHSRVPR